MKTAIVLPLKPVLQHASASTQSRLQETTVAEKSNLQRSISQARKRRGVFFFIFFVFLHFSNNLTANLKLASTYIMLTT